MTPTPILISISSAFIGAMILVIIFRRFQFNPAYGALLGAAGGLIGGNLFMVPLNYCPFIPPKADMPADKATLTVGFGVFLVGAGVASALIGLGWLARQRYERKQGWVTAPASAQAVFRGRPFIPWLLLLPTLIILLVFLYYPSLDTLRVSTLLRFVNIDRTRFVCVDNFVSLLTDLSFLQSFYISFLIAFTIVGVGLFLSLLVATAAFQPVRGANIYRTLLIWPYAISPAVAGIIFSRFFDPITGGVNLVWDRAFGFKLPLLLDPMQATLAVILTSIWKTMGFGILFYIAGLQNVPNDLKEAAAIDGANVVQRFRHIVVPILSPITFFLIVTTMTYAFFDIYGTIDVLTAGGPSGSTSVMIYKIIQTGSSDLGLASAQSIVLFLIVIALTGAQFIYSRRSVTYGA